MVHNGKLAWLHAACCGGPLLAVALLALGPAIVGAIGGVLPPLGVGAALAALGYGWLRRRRPVCAVPHPPRAASNEEGSS